MEDPTANYTHAESEVSHTEFHCVMLTEGFNVELVTVFTDGDRATKTYTVERDEEHPGKYNALCDIALFLNGLVPDAEAAIVGDF